MFGGDRSGEAFLRPTFPNGAAAGLSPVSRARSRSLAALTRCDLIDSPPHAHFADWKAEAPGVQWPRRTAGGELPFSILLPVCSGAGCRGSVPPGLRSPTPAPTPAPFPSRVLWISGRLPASLSKLPAAARPESHLLPAPRLRASPPCRPQPRLRGSAAPQSGWGSTRAPRPVLLRATRAVPTPGRQRGRTPSR